MSKVRIHNMSVSLDGFSTGADQGPKAPFGHAGDRLMRWFTGTHSFRLMQGQEGGTTGIDDAFASKWGPGIGVEIMGHGDQAERRALPARLRMRAHVLRMSGRRRERRGRMVQRWHVRRRQPGLLRVRRVGDARERGRDSVRVPGALRATRADRSLRSRGTRALGRPARCRPGTSCPCRSRTAGRTCTTSLVSCRAFQGRDAAMGNCWWPGCTTSAPGCPRCGSSLPRRSSPGRRRILPDTGTRAPGTRRPTRRRRWPRPTSPDRDRPHRGQGRTRACSKEPAATQSTCIVRVCRIQATSPSRTRTALRWLRRKGSAWAAAPPGRRGT